MRQRHFPSGIDQPQAGGKDNVQPQRDQDMQDIGVLGDHSNRKEKDNKDTKP
jgi:hypothetical protein